MSEQKRSNVYYVHVKHMEPMASTMAVVATDKDAARDLALEMLSYHKDVEIIQIVEQEAPRMRKPDTIDGTYEVISEEELTEDDEDNVIDLNDKRNLH